MRRLLSTLLGIALTASCTSSHSRAGDDNAWRDAPEFERGVATIGDVLDEIGPPTQVYDFGNRIAFLYYLGEERRVGYSLVLYGDSNREYLFDRAVYFFDRSGVLEHMAMSNVALPRESEYERDPWTRPVVRQSTPAAAEVEP